MCAKVLQTNLLKRHFVNAAGSEMPAADYGGFSETVASAGPGVSVTESDPLAEKFRYRIETSHRMVLERSFIKSLLIESLLAFITIA